MNGDLPEQWQQELLWVFAAVNTLIGRKKSIVLSIVEKAFAFQEQAPNKKNLTSILVFYVFQIN